MILVSALIPTRGRPERLKRTIDSLFRNAVNPDRIEVCLRIDDDDEKTLDSFGLLGQWCQRCIKPRVGYARMGEMVQDCVDLASGTWVFLIDDDCTIEGNNWDEALSQIPPTNNVAQCEFYHLGCSKYGSGSCGPVGMIVPNRSWEKFGSLRDAKVADDFFYDTLVKQAGYTVNLLKGVVYKHQRDDDATLAKHRR